MAGESWPRPHLIGPWEDKTRRRVVGKGYRQTSASSRPHALLGSGQRTAGGEASLLGHGLEALTLALILTLALVLGGLAVRAALTGVHAVAVNVFSGGLLAVGEAGGSGDAGQGEQGGGRGQGDALDGVHGRFLHRRSKPSIGPPHQPLRDRPRQGYRPYSKNSDKVAGHRILVIWRRTGPFCCAR
ncbi:hypothetical protein CC_2907 [Caulobacter vibrioides CB15]|uniref:Uncharacterized protein n=1 Tax=Caulobacter vibrioides (strain ATCC 19089 / CIP 103742 / CB 15) TaxID=190650 RepID=Q9A4C9_CAUVC|nr:hypothetical protein CC_2907 [Caulobacter vibrioides CB15]